MKTYPWKNKTKKHPRGVCEAATSIWLEQISKQGIQQANKITPQECDALQSEVEAGTYTWAADLINLLAPGAQFDAFNGPVVTTIAEMIHVLDNMQDNDFLYISATNNWGGGHAVAVYKSQGTYYFFDPNYAIYSSGQTQGEIAIMATQIMTNLNPWSNIAVRFGNM